MGGFNDDFVFPKRRFKPRKETASSFLSTLTSVKPSPSVMGTKLIFSLALLYVGFGFAEAEGCTFGEKGVLAKRNQSTKEKETSQSTI